MIPKTRSGSRSKLAAYKDTRTKTSAKTNWSITERHESWHCRASSVEPPSLSWFILVCFHSMRFCQITDAKLCLSRERLDTQKMICPVCEAVIPSFNPDTNRPFNKAIKVHNAGKRHQRSLKTGRTPTELAYVERDGLRCLVYKWSLRNFELADTRGRELALALGVLATRLRAKYGDVDSARRAWAKETLSVLADARLEEALLASTSAILAPRRMAEVLGQEYELLRLIRLYL